jgi:hypothetical protein
MSSEKTTTAKSETTQPQQQYVVYKTTTSKSEPSSHSNSTSSKKQQHLSQNHSATGTVRHLKNKNSQIRSTQNVIWKTTTAMWEQPNETTRTIARSEPPFHSNSKSSEKPQLIQNHPMKQQEQQPDQIHPTTATVRRLKNKNRQVRITQWNNKNNSQIVIWKQQLTQNHPMKQQPDKNLLPTATVRRLKNNNSQVVIT